MKTEAIVGAFVIVCAAIFLATVYHVSNAQIKGARTPYRTYLRYAGGLEEGADVLFGGIKVGQVTAVRPDPQDPTRIEILMDVRQGTPLNAKSVAKLGSVTVITSPCISISMGSNDAPRLPANSVIPSLETISIDDTERKIVGLADSAQTLLEAVHTDVNQVTVDARQLIANLNGITGKPNQQHISEILTNADAMVTRISPKIDQISDQVVKLTDDANGLMAKMGPAVDNVNATVSNANQTITAVRDPLQTDLAEAQKTLDQARSAIADLQAAMRAKDMDINEHARERSHGYRQPERSDGVREGASVESDTDQAAQGPEGSPKPMTKTLASASVLTLLMAGCGGKILYPHYYALDIPPAPRQAVSDTRMPATLAVRRFETPPYLRQGRIVYRQAPAEIGFYDYHRWAADPAATVTTAVIDSLRSSRLFSFVKPYDGQSRQDYLMSGRLERLEEIDYGGSVRVEAKLSAELVDLRTDATVWTGDADETLEVETRNVNSVVVEMSHAVQKSIDRLVASLDQQLRAQ